MSSDIDDDDGPLGFVRSTPESLAKLRAEWLAEQEHDLRRWMVLDVGLAGEQLERNVAKAVARIAELYDEQSADWTAKVAAHAKRGAAPLH